MTDNGTPQTGAKTRHAGIVIVLTLFVCLAATYSVVTPLFEASDELSHYPLVKHYAGGGGLPVQDPANPGPWVQEGSQPPLYYWLASLVARLVPSGDPFELLPRNPHADIGLVRPGGNANMVIHTAAERFPYRDTALAIHLVRGLSLLLGALTVLFTYLIGLELQPRRPGLALAAAGVVACTPMFVFISGSVNNDNLVVALATASLWLMLRRLRRPQSVHERSTHHCTEERPQGARLQRLAWRFRSSAVRWALLGLLIGLAALTKVSGLGLFGLAGLALAWTSWRRRDWRLFLRAGTLVVGVAALVAGWWYLRNWRLYGDPLGFNMMVAIAGPRAFRPTLRQLLSEWQGFVRVYWGVFGGMNVVAAEWFYHVCDALALLGASGLVVAAVRRLRQRRCPDVEATARLALVAIWPLAVFAGLVRWTMLTPASQGRLMFPAIASLSYLLVLGWAEWEQLLRTAYCVLRKENDASHGTYHASRITPHVSRLTYHASRITHYVVLVTPLALLAALSVWVPFGVIAPAYAPPPLLTPAEQAAIPQRLDLTVGDQMELLGYRLDQAAIAPGKDLAVTLYWRAAAPMDLNYSVYIHLLDENGIKIAQRDIYPGRGLFPTTLWRPGDAIADTYVIRVPENTFRPNRLQVQAGLYALDSGGPLPVRDGAGRDLGSAVRLGEVLVLATPDGGIANRVAFNLEGRATLAGYDLDRTAVRAGETLHLTLSCRAGRPLADDTIVFAQILGPDGAAWAGKTGRLAGGWPQGQATPLALDLTLRPDTPPGEYYLDAGLYQAPTGRRLNVLDRWGHVQGDRAVLTRIVVLPAEPAPEAAQFTPPEVPHPLEAAFGDVALLKGYRLDQGALNPYEPLRLTLYWQAAATPSTAYTVFVHLLDDTGQVVAQHDGPPAYGRWPTTSWAPGQVVIDEHCLSLKDTTFSSQVLVEIGLYDPATLQRLPVAGGDDKVILPVRIDVHP